MVCLYKRIYNIGLNLKIIINRYFNYSFYKKMNNLFDPTDKQSVGKYIKSKYNCVKSYNNNTNRYMMLLYGPPACGKSKGVEYGIDIINKIHKEKLKRYNFYEINLDDIISDIPDHRNIIENELKILNDTKMKNQHETAIENIKKSYLETRNKHENIVEIMISDCLENNVNFTLESTGSNLGEWYFDLFRKLNNNGYRIVFIYPQVLNEDVLIERAYDRGLKMGRFITKDDYHKNKYIEKAEKNFEQILSNNHLFDIIFKYDGEDKK
jgi:hypothetical protein